MIPPLTGWVAQWLEHPSRIRDVPGLTPGLAFLFSSYTYSSEGSFTNNDGTTSGNRPTYSVSIQIEATLDNTSHQDVGGVASSVARADLVPER